MSGKYITNDIAVAAFFKLNNMKLLKFSRTNKFFFEFEDNNGIGDLLAMDFLNSEFRKFDDEMRSLKKMINSKIS
jgi:hypothetical protein